MGGHAVAELTIDPSRPDLVAAEGAYRRGHHAEAFHQFQVLASQGDVTGMSWVAFLYSRGEGVRQDYAAALEWYRKAAEQDDVYAEGEIGRFYETRPRRRRRLRRGGQVVSRRRRPG